MKLTVLCSKLVSFLNYQLITLIEARAWYDIDLDIISSIENELEMYYNQLCSTSNSFNVLTCLVLILILYHLCIEHKSNSIFRIHLYSIIFPPTPSPPCGYFLEMKANIFKEDSVKIRISSLANLNQSHPTHWHLHPANKITRWTSRRGRTPYWSRRKLSTNINF